MLRLTMERRGTWPRLTDESWTETSSPARRDHAVGWIVAGVAVVGLGVLAWQYLGPDLRRYLKIHSM